MRMTQNRLRKLNELFNIFEDRGFYIDREYEIEFLKSGGVAPNESFELIKKAYGDGWTRLASEYFDKKEYRRICTICKELKLDPPEYVHGD